MGGLAWVGVKIDILTISGTAITKTMLNMIFTKIIRHTYFSEKKLYLNNLGRAITSAFPRQKNALSSIYVCITLL